MTATEASGMHPIGMHTCLDVSLPVRSLGTTTMTSSIIVHTVLQQQQHFSAIN